MFRFHFGWLLDLDWGPMTMAATYGSESVGDVRYAEDWPLTAFRSRPFPNDTSAARCKRTSD
jgi:hypothetical protein